MSRNSSSATAAHATAVDPRAPDVVLTRPSLFVRVVMKPMTRILNPLVRRFAGRRHVRAVAQIHHRGRQSGREYVTPAGARRVGDTFWVPLTFGSRADWCRNVFANGGCTIRWRAAEYVVVDPTVVDRADALRAARSAFGAPDRLFMRAAGIRHFLRLRIVSPLAPVTP